MGVKYTGTYITCDAEADVMTLAGAAGDVAFAVDTKLRYMYNGSGWFPTDALRVIRGTTNVSLTATASTKFLTLPATTFRFVVIGVHLEVISLTGTVVTQPSLAIGATATNYNDIAASQILAGTLTAVGLASSNALTLASARTALAGNTDIYAKVNIAAVGPSVYTARFDLMGYFLS